MSSTTITNVVMPQMGEADTEATIIQWYKAPGDEVRADEPLLEISTQKVTVAIDAPVSGILAEVLYGPNDVVPVDEVIARIAPKGSKEVHVKAGKVKKSETGEEGEAPAAESNGARAHAEAEQGTSVVEQERQRMMRRRSTPLVRNICKELGLSIEEIPGSGSHGRVTKRDVEAFLEQQRRISAAQASQAPGRSVAPTPAPARPREEAEEGGGQQASLSLSAEQLQGAGARLNERPRHGLPDVGGRRILFDGSEDEYAEPMTTMRRVIAARMVESIRTSPHAYTVHEVDLTRMTKLRNAVRAEFEARYGVGLTPLAFILRAITEALTNFPVLNARIEKDNIVYHRSVNIGIAVAVEDGLIVPVIRHMEEKTMIGIARSIADLAKRARAKRLTPRDVEGGTFTVTSPGQKGALLGTPILNQPQVAILHVGNIHKAPCVIEGADGTDTIAIRSRAFLTLGLDHRAVDGWVADSFMDEVKERLERGEFQVLE